MLARLRKDMNEKDQGFTLIELLVVIIIIGILASVAVPVFLNQRKKGWDAQAQSDAKNLSTIEETSFQDNGYYAVGADKTAIKSVLADYNPSKDVTAVKITGYATGSTATSTAAVTTGSTAVDGYCVAVTSKSTKVVYFDSLKGGLLTGSATC